MGNVDDISQLCRLCLVKDQVNIPIFEESSDIGQTFLKINSCLPVKVSRDDNLPKKICDGCSYKLDMLYTFRNTSADSEKQLISWLNQAGLGTITQTALKDPLANAKPEITVKQETFDTVDNRTENENQEMGVDAQTYMIQQQLPYEQEFEFGEPSGSGDEMPEEPAPKRLKRAAALKKAPLEETDDAEDDLERAMQITKAEDEDSEDVDQPDYVEAPSTSADDQPGPSGVGKTAVEAPLFTILIKREDSEAGDSEFNTEYFSSIKRNYCNICDVGFENRSKLCNHRRKLHKPKDQVCTICQKAFKDKFQLKVHSIAHTKEKPYKCDLCGNSFKSKYRLNAHRKCHENPDQKFICSFCGKIYNQFGKAALEGHMRKHTKSGIKCKDCGEFVIDAEYKRHRLLHSDNKPYICSLCNRIFKYKNNYDAHVAKHNGAKFLCSFCGKELVSQVSLRIHLRIHTGEKPFSCSFCNKKFSANSYLKQHLRTHTNERPYVCEFCDKRFNQRGPLKIHIRALHTKETPYKCLLCFKGFVSRTLLNLHSRIHNDEMEEK